MSRYVLVLKCFLFLFNALVTTIFVIIFDTTMIFIYIKKNPLNNVFYVFSMLYVNKNIDCLYHIEKNWKKKFSPLCMQYKFGSCLCLNKFLEEYMIPYCCCLSFFFLITKMAIYYIGSHVNQLQKQIYWYISVAMHDPCAQYKCLCFESVSALKDAKCKKNLECICAIICICSFPHRFLHALDMDEERNT